MSPASRSSASSQDIAERLASLDACLVSDAMDALGHSGVLSGLHALWPCSQVAGEVVTVQLVDAATAANSAAHLGAAAIDRAAPGQVIVVDNDGRTNCGGWGGLLTLAAAAKGIAGVVVNGVARDLAEAQDLAFPIFALGTTPATARGRVVERATGVDLEIGGVVVRTGDFAIADRTGVVIVPAELAGAVLAKAEDLQRRERSIAGRLRGGASASEALGANYETMLAGAPED